METSRKARSHFRAGLLGGIILAGLGVLLLGPARGQIKREDFYRTDLFGRLSYDAPFWSRSSPPFANLVLVFVDEAALEKFGRMPDETLDRRAQIKLLQRLIDDGVDGQFVHEDLDLTSRGGRLTADIQAVIAGMGAANRDPERFPDPDRLDICRQENRHVAFAWASHFCFGAPLARLEGQIAFGSVL